MSKAPAPSKFMLSLLATGSILVASSNALAQCGGAPIFKEEIGGPARPDESVAKQSSLPSSLVYYVHHQNYLQPDWEQKTIAWPLLELAQQEGLSDHERFFLAQLNFMSFEAQEAYDRFSAFKTRDDWYGWMARQRLAIMDTRAFEKFDRLEAGVAYEQENFDYTPEYASIIGFGERSLCTQWAKTGEHERAVNLAISTLNKTPRDAAYGTLFMPASCFGSFKELDREAEAFDLAQSIRDNISKSLAKREKEAKDHPAYNPDLHENRIENRWYGRSLIAPYNYQSYRMERLVQSLDGFLACNRDGDETKCRK